MPITLILASKYGFSDLSMYGHGDSQTLADQLTLFYLVGGRGPGYAHHITTHP